MNARLAAIADAKLCPPDWEEGTAVVGYAGTLITVFYTIHDDGLDIDGIEHAGLVLEADDLSENMRNELVCCLRAQWDAEAA